MVRIDICSKRDWIQLLVSFTIVFAIASSSSENNEAIEDQQQQQQQPQPSVMCVNGEPAYLKELNHTYEQAVQAMTNEFQKVMQELTQSSKKCGCSRSQPAATQTTTLRPLFSTTTAYPTSAPIKANPFQEPNEWKITPNITQAKDDKTYDSEYGNGVAQSWVYFLHADKNNNDLEVGLAKQTSSNILSISAPTRKLTKKEVENREDDPKNDYNNKGKLKYASGWRPTLKDAAVRAVVWKAFTNLQTDDEIEQVRDNLKLVYFGDAFIKHEDQPLKYQAQWVLFINDDLKNKLEHDNLSTNAADTFKNAKWSFAKLINSDKTRVDIYADTFVTKHKTTKIGLSRIQSAILGAATQQQQQQQDQTARPETTHGAGHGNGGSNDGGDGADAGDAGSDGDVAAAAATTTNDENANSAS